MVYRCLEQDVGAFQQAVTTAAQQHGYAPEVLAARMMGRWKSGAPLILQSLAVSQSVPDDPEQPNNFDYLNDANGVCCPMASHIRKTNPRGGTPWSPRIMRRGIPYGPEFAADPSAKRGLLFVCYQASLENQFEFIQQTWVNNPGFQTGLDPVIGSQLGSQPRMFQDIVPGPGPTPLSLPIAGSYVTARAAAYFFIPSMKTLSDIPWQ